MKRFIATVVLVFLGVVGCSRRVSDFFPLIPGAVRIMKVYEQRVIGQDTARWERVMVTEAVRGEKNIPGVGKVWVVEAPVDSTHFTVYYFEKKADTVFKIIPGRGGRPERIVYLLQPLVVGKNWYDSDEERERFEVVAQESVSVPAGDFHNCFLIRTISERVNFQQNLWLVSGLGVVKREKHQVWQRGDTFCELFRREELVEYRVLKENAVKR